MLHNYTDLCKQRSIRPRRVIVKFSYNATNHCCSAQQINTIANAQYRLQLLINRTRLRCAGDSKLFRDLKSKQYLRTFFFFYTVYPTDEYDWTYLADDFAFIFSKKNLFSFTQIFLSVFSPDFLGSTCGFVWKLVFVCQYILFH